MYSQKLIKSIFHLSSTKKLNKPACPNTIIGLFAKSPNTVTRRIASCQIRQQNKLQSIRNALSVEGPFLRYINMINPESPLPHGLVEIEFDEDEDGT